MASVSGPTLESLGDITPVFRRQNWKTESHHFPWTPQQTGFTGATRKEEGEKRQEEQRDQSLLLKQEPLRGERGDPGGTEMVMLKSHWKQMLLWLAYKTASSVKYWVSEMLGLLGKVLETLGVEEVGH